MSDPVGNAPAAGTVGRQKLRKLTDILRIA